MTETRKPTTEVFEDLKCIMEYILETSLNYNEALYRIKTFNPKDLIKFKKFVICNYATQGRELTWGRLLSELKYEWFRRDSSMRDMINAFIKYDGSFPGNVPSRRLCGIKRGD